MELKKAVEQYADERDKDRGKPCWPRFVFAWLKHREDEARPQNRFGGGFGNGCLGCYTGAEPAIRDSGSVLTPCLSVTG